MTVGEKIMGALFRPVDGRSLAVFRILFGLIIMVEVWRYADHGWIASKYITPGFHFAYLGLTWITPFEAPYIYWVFFALAVAGFLVMIGLFYRFAAVALLLLFSYVFLLDETQYLNHFYFTMLLAAILAAVPAARAWSVDAWRARRRERAAPVPETAGPAAVSSAPVSAPLSTAPSATSVPGWSYILLKGQIEIMLIWAGLVKIDADWLAGRPLADWLADQAYKYPVYIADLLTMPEFGVAAAWGSVILHLVGAPLLLVRRTRLPVYLIYCGFHLSNHSLWQIGIFPWLTIAGMLIFFPADWPARLMDRLCRGLALLPLLRPAEGWLRKAARILDLEPAPAGDTRPLPSAAPPPTAPLAAAAPAGRLTLARKAVAGGVILWLGTQVLLPVRPYLYDGAASWNEQGHRFSWRMKLRDKSGRVRFRLVDPVTGQETAIDLNRHLTARQRRKMAVRPDMILQFAHHLRDEYRARHGHDPHVYVRSRVRVNDHPPATMIDPDRDLATVPFRLIAQDDFILPHPQLDARR